VTVPAISTRIKANLLEFDPDGFVKKNQFREIQFLKKFLLQAAKMPLLNDILLAPAIALVQIYFIIITPIQR